MKACRMNRALLFVLLLFAPAAFAYEAPMLYSRTHIVLHLAKPVSSANASIAFDTEVREAASVARTPGWYNFASLEDFRAAMMAYGEPTPVRISPGNEFAPFDIVLVNAYGEIVQIMPKLVLAELEAPIASVEPVQAVLYLRGGTCEKFGIGIGDRVEYGLFKKRPVVLSAPAAQTK